MQWGQIKLILIISFLVLDVYLLIQFLDKKEQADYSVIEEQQSTFEELLAAESISIPELKTDDSGTYLSVKQQLLTAEDLSLSKDQLDQEVSLINDYFILSTFKKTFAVKTEQSKDYYEEIKKNIFFDADAYSYWGWNEKMNVLIYFQEKTDSTVYYS